MITLNGTVPLLSLGHPDARWVQERLIDAKYLKEGNADGVVGSQTLAAFNAWKLDSFQNQPGMIGPGSVGLLNQLGTPDPVSEQPAGLAQKTNPQAGRKSGKEVILPVVGRVFANQWVDPRFPFFTWGEMTNGLTRIPNTEKLVRDGLKLIAAIGKARAKHKVVWRITSGYRPPDVNRAVGGASRSTHLLLRGADVSPVNADYGKVVAIARATPEIKGIGFGQRRGFIHLDIGWDDDDKRREFGY